MLICNTMTIIDRLCGAAGRKDRCGLVFSEQMPVVCPTVDSVFYTGPDVVPGPPNNATTAA